MKQSNDFKPLNDIEPIKTLSQIAKEKKAKLVWMLAKKTLPEKCLMRHGDGFATAILLIISEIVNDKKQDIVDLRQICNRCVIGPKKCSFYQKK